MFATSWAILKATVNGYIEDGCLSRGAAIAYYTVFSLAPVLIIVIAIAGLAFGADAARGALMEQIGGLMGRQGADAIQTMITSTGIASTGQSRSGWAGALGVATLLVTASGVFSEMQAALNAIWRARPRSSTVSRLVRARLASLGLVMTLGFLLLVSLVVSTVLSALGSWLNGLFPAAHLVMQAVSFVVSLALVAVLFAAIYKALPDTSLAWRDVIAGAIATALLFDIGKFLISLYLGSSSVASSFGAAGALALVLLWIYYSSQIFLLGAEFTRAYADIVHHRGPDTVNDDTRNSDANDGARAVAPQPAEKAPAPGAATHRDELQGLKAELRKARVTRR